MTAAWGNVRSCKLADQKRRRSALSSGRCGGFSAFLLLIVTFALACGAWAQTTQPGAAQAFEEQPLKISPAERVANQPKPGVLPGSQNGSEAQRVGLALLIVIGAIFLLRWVGRKMFLLPNGARSNKGIKVLSRSILSPKQQVLLLQVGKRVIVVGDSGGNMNALCEISEPDEVAGLLGELKKGQPEIAGRSFGNLFGKAKEPFDGKSERDTTAGDDVPEELGLDSNEDVSGLLEKVRLMRQQFKK